MADAPSSLPPPSPEHRRIAAEQFERARQVLTSGSNHDYAIQLLLACCKLDPANLIYRQALRRTQKLKFKNNLRGSWLAGLFNLLPKARMRSNLKSGNYLLVLELGERVLTRNPWDIPAQMWMAPVSSSVTILVCTE